MNDENLLRYDKKKIIVFFDYESENLCLNLKHNLVWQICMIKTRGGEIIDKYTKFIKWYRPPNVSAEAAKITHFNPENIEKYGTDYNEVIKTTVEWTKEANYLVGSNTMGFDVYFLFEFYRMVGEDPYTIMPKMLDTHPLAKGLKTGIVFDPKTTSLLEYQYRLLNTRMKGIKTGQKALADDYGIEYDPMRAHDAEYDVLLNKKIFDKIKFQVEI